MTRGSSLTCSKTVTVDGSTASAVPGVNRNHLHTIAGCLSVGRHPAENRRASRSLRRAHRDQRAADRAAGGSGSFALPRVVRSLPVSGLRAATASCRFGARAGPAHWGLRTPRPRCGGHRHGLAEVRTAGAIGVTISQRCVIRNHGLDRHSLDRQERAGLARVHAVQSGMAYSDVESEFGAPGRTARVPRSADRDTRFVRDARPSGTCHFRACLAAPYAGSAGLHVQAPARAGKHRTSANSRVGYPSA